MRLHRLLPGVAGAALVLAAVANSTCVAASAPELPELKPGMWELKGVVDGRPIEGRKCASPSRDILEENAVLERAGNRYTFQSDCEMKTRSGRVLRSNRTSVLTVDGDSHFQLRVRGMTNRRPVAETVTGRRVGDCEK